MSDLVEAAERLALEMTEPGVTGVILIRQEGADEPSSAFATVVDDNLAITVAMALDDNPALIGLFVKALRMVRSGGNSKDDPGFAPVIFAGEGRATC